ncbi:hypothetical protein D3C76_1500240 [compost metagenome]
MDKALPWRTAHQVGFGHPDIVEEQHGGVLSVQADLAQWLGFAEALAACLHQNQGNVLGALA